MTYEEYKIKKLSFVLQQFCTLNGLPFMCAEDLLHDHSVSKTPYQIGWLKFYCELWSECIINPQIKEKHHGF